MGNVDNDNTVDLGGKVFSRVKNGLDEGQVAAYVNELIDERDKLAESNSHIASLSRLAEKTVTEADRLAEQIKAEAVDKAQAESNAILEKATEQALRLAEEKEAEAIKKANEKAENIQVEAQRKAALLLENGRRLVQEELGKLTNQHFSQVLEDLEGLKQQALAARAGFEEKLFQFQREDAQNNVIDNIENGDATSEQVGKTTKDNEMIDATDRADVSTDLGEIFQAIESSGPGKMQCEVEILPPVDVGKIMEILARLDQMPEVDNTEIIPKDIDKPSILVVLREPINLVDVLRAIPEVAYVEQVKSDQDDAEEVDHIKIGLSKNAVSKTEK